jgi:hypothetical protein
MITRRYREPRGLHSDQDQYGFYVRLAGEDRELMKRALEVATERLGGRPSNPLLLVEMMKVFTSETEGQ